MKPTLWILGLAAVIGAGFYYYRADVGAAPPQLVFAQVTRGNVVSTVDATGTLQTVDSVDVGTQVSGTISALGADFNDQVKRGADRGDARSGRSSSRRFSRWSRRSSACGPSTSARRSSCSTPRPS